MKIENQVCTLEQAKKLKELIKQYETNFYWVELPNENYLATKKNVDDNLAFDRSLGDNMVAVNRLATAWKSIHPAYTVAELGVMIPEHCDSRKDGSWWVCDEGLTGDCVTFHGDTEAEARAAMLIYLLENNFTKPEEVNQRLAQ